MKNEVKPVVNKESTDNFNEKEFTENHIDKSMKKRFPQPPVVQNATLDFMEEVRGISYAELVKLRDEVEDKVSSAETILRKTQEKDSFSKPLGEKSVSVIVGDEISSTKNKKKKRFPQPPAVQTETLDFMDSHISDTEIISKYSENKLGIKISPVNQHTKPSEYFTCTICSEKFL